MIYWCKDHIGPNHNLSPATQVTVVTSFTWNKASTSFSPYTFVAIWQVERVMNQSINGQVKAIYAFGSLSFPEFQCSIQ